MSLAALLPDWLARDYVWLATLVVGLGSATMHLVGALWGWQVLRRLVNPPASATERDLAGGRLVLAITGWVLVAFLAASVAAIAVMWPPQPLRATLIRWLSGIGMLAWAVGMAWERRLRVRVLRRERRRAAARTMSGGS